MLRKSSFVSAAIVTMAACGPAVAQEFQVTSIVDLGAGVSATDMNDLGQVVGSFRRNGFNIQFITGANGTNLTELGQLAGHDVYVDRINNSGQLAGSFQAYNPQYEPDGHAFVTGAKGAGFTDLGSIGGRGTYTQVTALNNAGQLVGNTWGSTGGGTRAFVSNGQGGLRDLGTLNGGTYAAAYGINGHGQIVGVANAPVTSTYSVQRVLLADANGSGLTGLVPPDYPYEHAAAIAINDNGVIVGSRHYVYGAQSDTQVFTIQNGQWTNFDILGGFNATPSAINNAGLIVGAADVSGYDSHAFIARAQDTKLTDLNTLVKLNGNAYLDRVIDINEADQLIASSSDGHTYFLTVTSVPEPQTYALLMVGCGALLTRRRKKN